MGWLEWKREVTGLTGKQGGPDQLKIQMEAIIWKCRCEAKFRDEKPNPTIILERVLWIAKVTWERGTKKTNNRRRSLCVTRKKKWKKSDVGIIKIICDGA